MTEASTLPWSADRQTGGWTGKVDRMSVRSGMSLPEVSSCTESERELKAEGERRGGRVSLNEGVGLSEDKIIGHLMEEEPGENLLPEKAAQVFSPAVNALHSPSSLRNWELDTDVLKMGVSLMTSALFFPLLVWGGFVFLPFDAPLLDGAPLRLIYTLRCSVFAATPIILGESRITEETQQLTCLEAELQEVTVHQRFITDSASLFLIYFLQLVVMAMYLSQEQLKLVPLLTILFAFGRLAYWVAAAFGSSIRGFGFGLSFLPSIVMMAANFYFIFTMDAASSIFSLPLEEAAAPPPAGRQRFWG
uniref:Transmembrane protein 79b n=1 Tax=Amphilophus citrinellus TaxID=61819 RepID=A0A3Q0T0X0_AMPCI